MTYTQDDLLPLSGLQHILFCERQCALIHVEQVWDENRLTAEGRIMHEHVHEADSESRGNKRVEYALPLRSLRLGLIAKADVVEFHKKSTPDEIWLPYPVEYKHGKPKKDDSDKVQLCAQAMCLEEMMDVEIPEGAIFYGKTRHRLSVTLDDELRMKTEETSRRFHALVDCGKTPKPAYARKCDSCSVYEKCLPKTVEKGQSVNKYILDVMRAP
jgi:CRISPR-associated exonuclease Cas4